MGFDYCISTSTHSYPIWSKKTILEADGLHLDPGNTSLNKCLSQLYYHFTQVLIDIRVPQLNIVVLNPIIKRLFWQILIQLAFHLTSAINSCVSRNFTTTYTYFVIHTSITTYYCATEFHQIPEAHLASRHIPHNRCILIVTEVTQWIIVVPNLIK